MTPLTFLQRRTLRALIDLGAISERSALRPDHAQRANLSAIAVRELASAGHIIRPRRNNVIGPMWVTAAGLALMEGVEA
jgi:hypothetical protein